MQGLEKRTGIPAPAVCVPAGLAMASVGDRAVLTGGPAGVYLCVENHCRPFAADPEGHGMRVWRAGLAELRRASTPEGATSREALTLALGMAVLCACAGVVLVASPGRREG